MPNYIENNPAKSIIIYTLTIIGSTWIFSNFILDENKINFYKAQVSSEQGVNRELEAKISVLESNITALSNDNRQLMNWLSGTDNSFPALKKKIKNLEEKLAISADAKITTDELQANQPYKYSESFVVGQSFTDPLTSATIGVSDLYPDRTAEIYLFLPDKPILEKRGVKPGTSWEYSYKDKKYKLILNRIEWIGNKLQASVLEIE